MNQYQISKIRQKVDLTRFANSTIHQNVTMDEVETKILYAAGKRIGVLSSIGKEIDIETAKHIAQNSMENPDFVSLVDNEEAGVPEYRGSYSPSTAQTKPMHRAEIVKEVIELCNKKRLQTAGYLSTGFYEMEISNSLGVNVRDQATMAEFSLTVTGEGTGYSTATSFDLSLLNITDLTNRAIETAMKNIKPVMIEPKKYRVILEPMAVHDLFGFLSWLGFSGLMYYEGRSCFAGRLNQEVASPLITLYDEPITGLPNLGIDVEGVARRKTILIEKGVLKNVVYDSYSAHKIGTKSTGNAYELISPFGGFPFSITLAPGETSFEKMLGETEYGLLIKRFWYIRVISWKEGILTGMTRDGTFLIENGRIGPAVKNLRFQIALPELLKKIVRVGDKLSLYEFGRFPHLLIDDFNITGMTGKKESGE